MIVTTSAEIISPLDGAALAAGEHAIQWRAEPNGYPILRLLVLSYEHDRGWPGIDLKALPSDADDGSIVSNILTTTSARLWSVAADGAIAESSVTTLTVKVPDSSQ